WRPATSPEPVTSFVAPRVSAAMALGPAAVLPDLRGLRSRTRRNETLAAAVEQPLPEAAGPQEAAASAETAGRWPHGIQFPGLAIQRARGNPAGEFAPAASQAAAPADAAPNLGTPLVREPRALPVAAAPAPEAIRGLAAAGPVLSDFVCQRTAMAHFADVR